MQPTMMKLAEPGELDNMRDMKVNETFERID